MSQQSTGASPWEKGGTQFKPRVVSIEQGAKYIGRSRSHLYDLMHAGTVRGLKSGKRLLVVLADLDAYLDALPIAKLRPSHPEKFKNTTTS